MTSNGWQAHTCWTLMWRLLALRDLQILLEKGQGWLSCGLFFEAPGHHLHLVPVYFFMVLIIWYHYTFQEPIKTLVLINVSIGFTKFMTIYPCTRCQPRCHLWRTIYEQNLRLNFYDCQNSKILPTLLHFFFKSDKPSTNHSRHSCSIQLPNRLAEAFRPVLTCPMWRQFSNPITSILWSPMSKRKSGKVREREREREKDFLFALWMFRIRKDLSTLNGYWKVNRVEALSGNFLICCSESFHLIEWTRAWCASSDSFLWQILTPQIWTAMAVGDVKKCYSLQWNAIQIQLDPVTSQLNELVEIFTRGRECFTRGVLKIPQFILHPRIKFVRIFFAFQVKFHAYGGIDTNCWFQVERGGGGEEEIKSSNEQKKSLTSKQSFRHLSTMIAQIVYKPEK